MSFISKCQAMKERKRGLMEIQMFSWLHRRIMISTPTLWHNIMSNHYFNCINLKIKPWSHRVEWHLKKQRVFWICGSSCKWRFQQFKLHTWFKRVMFAEIDEFLSNVSRNVWIGTLIQNHQTEKSWVKLYRKTRPKATEFIFGYNFYFVQATNHGNNTINCKLFIFTSEWRHKVVSSKKTLINTNSKFMLKINSVLFVL